MAVFVRDLFGDLPARFRGLMEIRCEQPVVPITLKLTANEPDELILTTLPVADLTQSAGHGLLIIPQVGFGQELGEHFNGVVREVALTISPRGGNARVGA